VKGEATKATITALRKFIESSNATSGAMTALSLFSGAGLSDLGYERAGFHFVIHVEINPRRAIVGEVNFPGSKWIMGDVKINHDAIIKAYREYTNQPLDLMVATPPCQGMSSSNPGRGKSSVEGGKLEEKNRLLLEIVPLIRQLSPRLVVAENVRPILNLYTSHEGRKVKLISLLREMIPDYEVFTGVINVADYGIPQDRRRAIIVAIRLDQPFVKKINNLGLLPWPKATHSEHPTNGTSHWVSIRQWLESLKYEPLDASTSQCAKGKHPLHFVPYYSGDRYLQVSQIPPYSGRNAYENDICPSCGSQTAAGLILCLRCGGMMRNRPYVVQDGRPRLIKGFHSSYRRMNADRPAPTIMTNSSHIGSDFKIHPWENRVLSILECADLQTVPRFYDWSGAINNQKRLFYLIRNLIGEAFPPYFTYLHGLVLKGLLCDEDEAIKHLALA
jgi:DNA (cytosine-5)-methyltransferase 1